MWQRLKLRDWYDGIKLDAFEECRIINCQIAEPDAAGVAIIAGKTADAAQGANLYIINVFQRGTNGTDGVGGTAVGATGLKIMDADAVFVINSDFGGNVDDSLLIEASTRSSNHHFTQTFFDATKNGANVRIGGNAPKTHIQFTGCWFASAGRETGGSATAKNFWVEDEGVGNNTIASMVITGGLFFNANGIAIHVESNSAEIQFNGITVHAQGGSDTAGHTHGAYINTSNDTANNIAPSFRNCRFTTTPTQAGDDSIHYTATNRQHAVSNNYLAGDLDLTTSVPYIVWGNWSLTTATTHRLYKGNARFDSPVGIGAAPEATIAMKVRMDVATVLYGYTDLAGGTKKGVEGYASNTGTANYGVYATATGATTNHHFHDAAGNYSDATAWHDVSDPAQKALIREVRDSDSKEFYSILDKIKVKGYRYKSEVPDGEDPKDTIERFGVLADELPDFLSSQDKKGVSGSRLATYLIVVIQYQKKLIDDLRLRVKALEAK